MSHMSTIRFPKLYYWPTKQKRSAINRCGFPLERHVRSVPRDCCKSRKLHHSEVPANGGMRVQSMQRANCDGAYERPSDAFLSGSMSDCAEKGFVRNAMHPEASAALRMAGLLFPVM